MKPFLISQGKSKRERGLALILVLSLTVLIVTVISDVIFQSEITTRKAHGERDRLRAEMSAITGAQFVRMLLLLDTKFEEVKTALPPGADSMIPNLGKPLYAFLDGFPIGSEGLSEIGDLTKVNINALMDAGLVEALKAVPGYFMITSYSENTRLNLNIAYKVDPRALFAALKRIFSGPRETKFLQDKGFPSDRLAANVIDYIDENTVDIVDGSDEKSQYTSLKFEHGPKNGPLESLEELRRIPGFHDDDVFNVFSPYFTVWPVKAEPQALDINAAPLELVAALSSPDGSEAPEESLDKLEDARAEGTLIKTRGVVEQLTAIANNSKEQRDIARLLAGADESTPPKAFVHTIFRFDIRGVSNSVERTLQVIYERKSPNAKGPAAAKAPPIRILSQRFL